MDLFLASTGRNVSRPGRGHYQESETSAIATAGGQAIFYIIPISCSGTEPSSALRQELGILSDVASTAGEELRFAGVLDGGPRVVCGFFFKASLMRSRSRRTYALRRGRETHTHTRASCLRW